MQPIKTWLCLAVWLRCYPVPLNRLDTVRAMKLRKFRRTGGTCVLSLIDDVPSSGDASVAISMDADDERSAVTDLEARFDGVPCTKSSSFWAKRTAMNRDGNE